MSFAPPIVLTLLFLVALAMRGAAKLIKLPLIRNGRRMKTRILPWSWQTVSRIVIKS